MSTSSSPSPRPVVLSPEVHHRTVAGLQVVVEREIEELPARELHRRGVEVDLRRTGADETRCRLLVPADAQLQSGQRLSVVGGQRQLLALGQLDHGRPSRRWCLEPTRHEPAREGMSVVSVWVFP